jgi:hypothetical protein
VHELAAFLGRFHTVWVHLPIGIFVLLAILEAAGLLSRVRGFRWLPALTASQRTLVLALGAAAAVWTAFLGWLLAHGGDYDLALVQEHQKLGIASACAAVLLLALHRLRWAYGPALVFSLALLVLAGHAGGTISHGNGYLTDRMPAGLRRVLGIPVVVARPRPSDAAHALVFTDAVQPILEARCVSCHGASKSNGGLRVDTWEFIQLGGKHGPLFNPAAVDSGEMLRRIDLPPEAKGHMPPLGKPQLADDDLAVLEWWIGAGAVHDKVVAEVGVPPRVGDILDARLGGKPPEAPPYRVATLVRSAPLAARLGILIRPMSPDGPWIDVNARVAGKAFGDAQLAELAPVATAVTWLDVSGTSVTDAGLSQVRAMHWLQRLRLDETQVSDKGLASLSRLKHLEYLNLRGTAVTDAGLASLASLTSLRSLFVWQTAVTPAAVKALGDALVDKRRLARWKADKADLELRIEADRFDGNTGSSLRLAPKAAADAGP